jgi:hypothetical protein
LVVAALTDGPWVPITGAMVLSTAVTSAVLASISFLAKVACDSTTSIGVGRTEG